MTSSAEAATVTVVNQSGQTIVATYYRSTNSSQWRNTNFGKMYNGTRYNLRFNVNYRYIDLSFRLADGTYQERTGIDLYNDFTLYVGG